MQSSSRPKRSRGCSTGGLLIGDARQFVEAAAGQRAEAREMRLKLGADVGREIELQQTAKGAVDLIEIVRRRSPARVASRLVRAYQVADRKLRRSWNQPRQRNIADAPILAEIRMPQTRPRRMWSCRSVRTGSSAPAYPTAWSSCEAPNMPSAGLLASSPSAAFAALPATRGWKNPSRSPHTVLGRNIRTRRSMTRRRICDAVIFLRLTAAAFFIPQSRARQSQEPKVNQSTHDPFLSLRSQRPVFSQIFHRMEPAQDMV